MLICAERDWITETNKIYIKKKKENTLLYIEELYIKEDLYLCVWLLCWRYIVLFLAITVNVFALYIRK